MPDHAHKAINVSRKSRLAGSYPSVIHLSLLDPAESPLISDSQPFRSRLSDSVRLTAMMSGGFDLSMPVIEFPRPDRCSNAASYGMILSAFEAALKLNKPPRHDDVFYERASMKIRARVRCKPQRCHPVGCATQEFPRLGRRLYIERIVCGAGQTVVGFTRDPRSGVVTHGIE